MKKITLMVVIAFLFLSCNSDDNDISSRYNLSGRWNWIVSSGGYGSPVTPETMKQTMVVEFSGSSLKTYLNGNLSQNQKFYIKIKKSIYGGNRKMIVIDKGNSLTNEYYYDRSFEIIDDKLYLREECADCYTHEFDRKK